MWVGSQCEGDSVAGGSDYDGGIEDERAVCSADVDRPVFRESDACEVENGEGGVKAHRERIESDTAGVKANERSSVRRRKTQPTSQVGGVRY